MKLNDAIVLLSKTFPGRKILGYWAESDRFIFKTKPIFKFSGVLEPNLFVVDGQNKCYGVNPMDVDLDSLTYQKLY